MRERIGLGRCGWMSLQALAAVTVGSGEGGRAGPDAALPPGRLRKERAEECAWLLVRPQEFRR